MFCRMPARWSRVSHLQVVPENTLSYVSSLHLIWCRCVINHEYAATIFECARVCIHLNIHLYMRLQLYTHIFNLIFFELLSHMARVLATGPFHKLFNVIFWHARQVCKISREIPTNNLKVPVYNSIGVSQLFDLKSIYKLILVGISPEFLLVGISPCFFVGI